MGACGYIFKQYLKEILMENYLEIYSQWYPKSYGLKEYPKYTKTVYSVSERTRLLDLLTKKQRGLIERHRKYMIRSLFLRRQFLQETDWDFVELKIDANYHINNRKNKLYCKCGRTLKYQFIVQSKTTKRKMELGITHFSDHLKISPKIANEIKKGINTVDIALDDLLYLIDKQVVFPEDLWKRYCIAHYRNNTLTTPAQLNRKLMERILDFRECQMPIFTSDYRAVLEEISKVNKIALVSDEGTFVNNKLYFERYCSDLVKNRKNEILDSKKFLSENVNAFATSGEKFNLSIYERDIKSYISNLHDTLNDIKSSNHIQGKLRFEKFASSSKGLLIDKQVNWFIYQQFIKYGWHENFYLSIPKYFRKKLKDEKNKSDATNETYDSPEKEHLMPNKKPIIAQGKNKLEREINQKVQVMEKKELFFEFLYNILFLPKNIEEIQIATLLDLLFESYDFDEWKIAYILMESRNKFLADKDFYKAYRTIPYQMYSKIREMYLLESRKQK